MLLIFGYHLSILLLETTPRARQSRAQPRFLYRDETMSFSRSNSASSKCERLKNRLCATRGQIETPERQGYMQLILGFREEARRETGNYGWQPRMDDVCRCSKGQDWQDESQDLLRS